MYIQIYTHFLTLCITRRKAPGADPNQDSGSYQLVIFDGNGGNGNKSKGLILICPKNYQTHDEVRIC